MDRDKGEGVVENGVIRRDETSGGRRTNHGAFGFNVDVVGVVPAAGRARRIAPLPCSKELYPVGFHADGSNKPRPKVVSQYLLEKYRLAGVRHTYIVLREGKWDIAQYFGVGDSVGQHLAYLVITGSGGPPETIDHAYPFLENKIVVFGFPDMLFTPDDVFAVLLERLAARSTDAVLGLFRAQNPRAMDMVDLDREGRVRSLVLKPLRTKLAYAWVCAVWTPRFTGFLHRFISSWKAAGGAVRGNRRIDAQGDVRMGAVFQAAVREGLRIDGVRFPSGRYIDIGTPKDLAKAVRLYHAEPQ